MKSKTIVYFQTGTVGDFLMSLYFADAVRRGAALQQKPCPTVAIAVRRNADFLRPLAQAYPHVQVISMGKGEVVSGIKKLLSFQSPRIVITWPTLGRVPLRLKVLAKIVAGTSGSLVGYDDSNWINSFVYTNRWQFDPAIRMHESMCELANRVEFPAPCVQPTLTLSVPKQEGEYILFHLFPAESSRTWSAKRWNNFLKEARQRWPEITFVFTGAPSDKQFIQEAIAGITFCEDKIGKLSAQELVSCIDGAKLFIGVDSGITHLAAFRGAPSVIVGSNRTPFWSATYSPNTTWLTAPCSCTLKKDCRVVEADGVTRLQCVSGVTDKEVLGSMENTLMLHSKA